MAFSTRRVREDNRRLIPRPETTMTLHHTLYRKLTVLIPAMPQVPEYAKSQVPGHRPDLRHRHSIDSKRPDPQPTPDSIRFSSLSRQPPLTHARARRQNAPN